MGEEDEELFGAQSCRGGKEEKSGATPELDRERRYAELFRQLDLNQDGKVDIHELKTALAARGLQRGEAEEVRQAGAHTNVGQVHTQVHQRLNI